MSNLIKKYRKEVVPNLMKELSLNNVNAVPKLEKVVVNVCLGLDAKDASFARMVEKNLQDMTGQKAVRTNAKKSISNFKIRKGMFLGMKVTLRNKRMYDFVERLIHVTLPRTRDFQGIFLKNIDAQGNLSIGFKDQIAFPEVSAEGIERLHGLEVSIVSTAKNREQGIRLFSLLGFPIQTIKNNA